MCVRVKTGNGPEETERRQDDANDDRGKEEEEKKKIVYSKKQICLLVSDFERCVVHTGVDQVGVVLLWVLLCV